MSSSDFRQIALQGEPAKAERLFRAAVSAFCSITRPSRRELAQLDDLALPLFDAVSKDSRRYVAAALSECDPAPGGLVRRLCDEPIDIAAPLLMRSTVLTDIDLISLIGRHGLMHARAIGARQTLNPIIRTLVQAIEATSAVAPLVHAIDSEEQDMSGAPPSGSAGEITGSAAEDTRRQLRGMMVPASPATPGDLVAPPASDSGVRLRDLALTGNLAFFQTALADALDIEFSIAQSITETSGYSTLTAALRAIEISEDRAFVITAAIYPRLFEHPQAIRLFIDRYRLLHREAAKDALRGWRAESLARATRRARKPLPTRAADNQPGPGQITRQKAS